MAAPMSDVAGYRSDGGGLGQDQGISKQLRGILTAKLPLLSAPGTVLENSLYYDINSSSVTAVEEQASFNKDRIAFNNLQMGATPSAYIPSVLFANTIFWVVELPEYAVPSTYNVNLPGTWGMNIPRGWGFHAIQDVIVYMGASSIAQIQISGRTNFHIALATCESWNKRKAMIEGAGQYLNPRDYNSPLAPLTPNTSLYTQKTYGDFFTDGNYQQVSLAPWLAQAVVPLRVPWSSMAILDKRLSLDTKLSTQPIQIALHTKPLAGFAALGTAFLTGQTAIGANFGSSTIQLWQEELSDKSLSVRNELLAMPEFNVGYPFQYAQSIPFQVGSLTGDTGTLSTIFTMNITSIINSDLTTFLFDVTWSGRADSLKNSGQFCPTYGEELIDIELLLNGQRFFAFDKNDYPYVTLAKQLDSTGYITKMPAVNTTLSAAQTVSFNPLGHYYEFNNSRLRSIIAESHMQNTARFTNQTFQLKFRINRSSWYLQPYVVGAAKPYLNYNANNPITEGYQLNMSYLYNAVYLVGGDGGTTKLITN